VREALAQLRDEGLVSIEPQKGARVFSLSEEEVSQICDFRQAIEIAAFELALARDPVGLSVEMSRVVEEMARKRDKSDERGYLSLDTTFHHLIFEKAGNIYLTASYDRYTGKIAALRTHLAKFPQHTDLSFMEHQRISAAVGQGDMAEIKSLLIEHIDRTRQAYKSASIVQEAAFAS
jgi:DNA-binding GntR family transcriptional regulator